MVARSKSLSIIDCGLKVEGKVNADGKLVIAGNMEGTLVGKNVVTARGSCVIAQAEVDEMVIAGDFQGDITARQSLRILQTGNFAGNITCKTLSLEAGGKLNGHVEPLEIKETTPVSGTGTGGTQETT
jgi:cytoskeletal protein CcmA (bactofilin family)